jgi:sugar O-acyltransferase (sialic acid O-acetyltransferase NeuD family)
LPLGGSLNKQYMKLAIFGYGGHAREVAAMIDHPVEFFVDDKYSNGSCNPISTFDPIIYKMIVAVADPKEREKIVNRLPTETKYFKFIHPTAIIASKDVEIGEGSYIGPNTIITVNVKIGKHAILNRGNQIGHDCRIGDYFSAMPGAIVSGNVNIGNKVYLGTNSSVIEKINLVDNITIGSNGSVVSDIMENGTYVGVPSKRKL